MTHKFPEARLESLCEEIVDCPHSTPKWTDSGEVVIRNQNIRRGRLDLSTTSYTDEENYQKRSRRIELRPNDLIITREAPMGEVCIVPEGLRCCLGQRMVALRTDSKKIIPRYLLFALQGRDVQHQIGFNEGTGSTVSNMRIPVLKGLDIPVPDLSNQKAIAHILGTLDDKIELNQKMNQTLEEIAKAIFKSWFVDFDPVRAKAEGRPTGLPPEISNLFPDELVDSEIGEIPKGWEVTSLGDVCEQVTKGTTPTSVGGKFSEDGTILFVKVESVSEGGQLLPSKFAKIDEETDSLLKRSQLREGDVLLSIAGTIGRSTIMPKRFLPANTNQALAILRCSGKEDFVLQTLRSDHIQQNFHSKIVQAVQANLSLGEIKATQCVLPPLDVHDRLIDMIRKIREANEIRNQETSILAELRDTLLPKLISGELRIPDAEKFLEEAGI